MEEQQKQTHRRLRPIVWVLLAAVILLICALIVRLSGCADKPAETEPAETEVPEAAAETPEPEPEVMTAEFFFTGDALIHGTVWMDADQGNGTYDFSGIVENVGRLAEGYDLKYYNQETILGGTELGLHGYPTFNSPQEVGDAMVNMGFGLVSTANNHSLDQGLTGIERSTEYWKRQEAEHGVHMAGTYSSQTEDVITVGVKATIIANGQVSEDDAYTIVKTIFEGKESIAHDKAKELDLEYASVCGLPYHPGAAKYFAEQGFTVETANP